LASSSVPEKTIKDILPPKTLSTLVPQEEVARVIKPAPSRYRNEIAKYIVHRNLSCRLCGRCAEVCRYGVHVLKPGYKYFAEPKNYLCIGPGCEKNNRHF
jgi:MinD superfamily P-loop ATPase